MKKLLIVVDYQKDFVNGSLGFKEAEYLDEYLASLIDQYHQNKDDVIFTFDTHQNNYLETQEGKNLPIEHCIKNSDGWKLYGKVNTAKKEHDICIEKTTFGSLELGNYLKDKNYQNVTLVGVVSNICVLSNAVIVKSALPETPIFIDVKGISSNDLTMQAKAISILDARSKKLFLGIYNEGKVIVEDCLINVDEFENYQKQYPDYEVVGDTSLVGLPEQEINLVKNIYTLSHLENEVENVDGLVPRYIKEVEAKKICQ